MQSAGRVPLALSSALSVSEDTPRDYQNFAAWTDHYGVKQGDGFQLTENYGDWSVMTAQSVPAGSKVLQVPAMLILSSERIQREEFPNLGAAIEALKRNNAADLIPQFFLWVKILKEYELGDQSPYGPWLNAMPRRFSTAVCFDEFEMQCLPPFVASLAKIDKINLNIFNEVLKMVDVIGESTKSNKEVTKWAYNVVFTRSWSNANSGSEIVPMADMLNHAAYPNVEVQYDAQGSCSIVLTRDVSEGEPLVLSYGNPTNPSRFLSTFGFLDQSPPATFCKIMAARPSQELKDIGYDFEKMVFYVQDGGVAQEVWDVLLYTVLEKNPQDRQAFYEAHMRGDEETKSQLHQKHILATCEGLQKHVDTMLVVLNDLRQKIDREGMNGHYNLPMIRAHNDFVQDTFQKVKNNLDQLVESQREMIAY